MPRNQAEKSDTEPAEEILYAKRGGAFVPVGTCEIVTDGGTDHDTTCPACDEEFVDMGKLETHAYYAHDGATVEELERHDR